MTDEELKKIASKIAKLLALATSDNANEAATARRQAQAMMDKYNLTQGDVAAAAVYEKAAKTNSKHQPPLYLSHLALLVCRAFGCEVVAQNGGGCLDSSMLFMGLGIKPELAAYTFDVLRRQLQKDRTAFTKGLSNRMKRTTKTRKADAFCDAWLGRIHRQVTEFAGTEHDKSAIAAYKKGRFKNLQDDTRQGRQTRADDYAAMLAGSMAAKDVELRRPVQNKRGTLLT